MRISHRLTWPGAWGFYLGGGGIVFIFLLFSKDILGKIKTKPNTLPPKNNNNNKKQFQ